MQRRKFITLLGGAAAAWPLTARAQQTERMRSIGVLIPYAESDPAVQSEVTVFRAALTKLGWTEGVNLRIEFRWGGGDADRIRRFAKELVDLRPDVIFGQTTPVVEALARETRTIPVVFVNVNDPVASGFVASFAHPGGNITGFSVASSEQGGKWVELLKEIAPRTLRMALLFNPATGVPLENFMPSIQAAASSFAVEVRVAPVRTRDEREEPYRRTSTRSRRRPHRVAERIQPRKSGPDHCAGGPLPRPNYLLPALLYGVRRFDHLWSRFRRTVSPGTRLHQPHPQGR